MYQVQSFCCLLWSEDSVSAQCWYMAICREYQISPTKGAHPSLGIRRLYSCSTPSQQLTSHWLIPDSSPAEVQLQDSKTHLKPYCHHLAPPVVFTLHHTVIISFSHFLPPNDIVRIPSYCARQKRHFYCHNSPGA